MSALVKYSLSPSSDFRYASKIFSDIALSSGLASYWKRVRKRADSSAAWASTCVGLSVSEPAAWG